MSCAEYRAIQSYYGERRSRRFDLPLMNHIDEGLRILDHIGAAPVEMKAWCLHPLVQNDVDLLDTLCHPFRLLGADPLAMVLAMEYRVTANASLSRQGIVRAEQILLSKVHSVNTLLIADKIQNRKDFLVYAGDHFEPERYLELNSYFQAWLDRLGLTANTVVELTDVAIKGDLDSALTRMTWR